MQTRRRPRLARLCLTTLLLFGLMALPQGAVQAAPNAPVNGSFEQGRGVGWVEVSPSSFPIVWDSTVYDGPVEAHSGIWYAFFPPRAGETSSISQTLTIASGSRLSFWYRLISINPCDASVAQVKFNATVLESWTLCGTNYTPDWTQVTVDLSAFAGQTGTLTFTAINSATNDSSILFDDILVYDVFADVSITDAFLPFIKALYNAGITSGCSTSPLMYCSEGTVTRGQMAVFIERAMGNTSPTPSPSGMFTDVPPGHPFKAFIEELYNDGITSGCSTSPLMYCPDGPVTRGQMAVFIERALGNFSPSPSPSGMFADVPPGHPFKAFIEEFYNDGITSGCSTSPLMYCPDSPVTRGQMAVFITRAFNLPMP